MLLIEVEKQELFNEKTKEFIYINACKLQLEHSLVSISKWERKWHKPFLSTSQKTDAEIRDYVRCMCMTSNVDPLFFDYIPDWVMLKINDYISDPMTATTFGQSSEEGKEEVITNEIIYWQMITLGIPVEFQKWHLNSLLTLIKVCSIKNNPDKKKMSRNDIIQRNKALNKARRAKHNTTG